MAGGTIRALEPCWVVTRPPRVPRRIYTAASTTPARLCALLFDHAAATPSFLGQFVANVSGDWMRICRNTALISGIELRFLVSIAEHLACWLQGRFVWFCVESNNVLSSSTRGDPNTDFIAILVDKLLDSVRIFSIFAWFSSIRSARTPSDLPTRGGGLPFPIRERAPTTKLNELLLLAKFARREPQWPPPILHRRWAWKINDPHELYVSTLFPTL